MSWCHEMRCQNFMLLLQIQFSNELKNFVSDGNGHAGDILSAQAIHMVSHPWQAKLGSAMQFPRQCYCKLCEHLVEIMCNTCSVLFHL